MPHLTSLNFFAKALEVSGKTGRVIASDIANADTAGFKARGVNFDETLQASLQGQQDPGAEYVRGLPTGLDGNDVSLDFEGTRAAANAARERESLTFLKGTTQSLITALRPQGPGNGG